MVNHDDRVVTEQADAMVNAVTDELTNDVLAEFTVSVASWHVHLQHRSSTFINARRAVIAAVNGDRSVKITLQIYRFVGALVNHSCDFTNVEEHVERGVWAAVNRAVVRVTAEYGGF